MFETEEWCGTSRDEFARKERRRRTLAAKARRDAVRQARWSIAAPSMETPMGIVENSDRPGTYTVERYDSTAPSGFRVQRITLPFVSILRGGN